jgi:hypothetical protein
LGDVREIARVYRTLRSGKLSSSVKGGVTLFGNRNREGAPLFDDLAMGLESGAISRGKAIKLSGAALAASALGLFASRGAEAQTTEGDVTIEAGLRRRCLRRGGDFCSRSGNRICCGEGGRRRRACCGPRGAACCNKNERCYQGKCRNEA